MHKKESHLHASTQNSRISCVLREIVVTEIHEMLKSLLASYATVIMHLYECDTLDFGKKSIRSAAVSIEVDSVKKTRHATKLVQRTNIMIFPFFKSTL